MKENLSAVGTKVSPSTHQLWRWRSAKFVDCRSEDYQFETMYFKSLKFFSGAIAEPLQSHFAKNAHKVEIKIFFQDLK